MIERRRMGRPREIENPVRVNISVSSEDYDRLYALAKQANESIPAIIRRGVISVLRNCVQAGTSA